MRKPPLFALGMCAAALLGQVSLSRGGQTQTSGQQTSGQQSAAQTQQTGKPPSSQNPQATPPPSPQTEKHGAAQQSQQSAKQAPAQKPQAAPPPHAGAHASNPKTQTAPPQTEKSSGQKVQAAQPSPQTGKQASNQNGPAAQPSQQTGKQSFSQKPQVVPPGPLTSKQASGQKTQAAQPPAIPPGYRPLSLKEGRTIVQEMSWADDEEGLSPDCSHLVHKLYEQAGHPYPYASSLDLYRGTGPFLRVRYAHPGDLVVWRGHVGIVVNPREHSFISTTSSGTRIQSYRSPYWRGRGYPHFFRYLTKSPLRGGTSEASNLPPALQPTVSKPKDPPQP